MVKCIDCFEEGCKKNGLLNNKQRYVCNMCGRHFVQGSTISRSIHLKREIAMLVSSRQLTYRGAGRRINASTNTIRSRVKLLKRGVI